MEPLLGKPETQSAGKGLARIRLAGTSQARTILPVLDGLSYSLAFASGDKSESLPSVAGNSAEAELESGAWTLTVLGCAPSSPDLPVLAGEASFSVAAGQTVDVRVDLYPAGAFLADGEGTLRYQVSFPPGLARAELAIIPLSLANASQGRTIDLLDGLDEGAARQAEELVLHAGYYRLALSLQTGDGKVAGKVEAVHLYQGIASFAASFGAGDFVPGGTFTSLAAMKSWLEARPPNTPDAPYLVALRGLDAGSLWAMENAPDTLVESLSSRYVDLDLSGCTGTSIGNQSYDFPSQAQKDYLVGLVLPDTIDDIGTRFLYNYANLKSVVLPDGLQSLGDYSLYWSESPRDVGIETIDLSRTALASLGSNAFAGCSNLREATFPATLTSVAGNVFKGCSQLETIIQQAPLISIGMEAFTGCSKLESISISAGATLNTGVFTGCSSFSFVVEGAGTWSAGGDDNKLLLTDSGKTLAFWPSASGSIAIPGGIEKIRSRAFQGNLKLAAVDLGTGLKEIGSSAFRETGLTSLTLGGNIETIGTYAFYECAALDAVTVAAQNLTVIPASAFERCSKLKTADLFGSKIQTINQRAFRDCTILASVSLPNTLTEVAADISAGPGPQYNNSAFANTPLLASFTVASGGPYGTEFDGKALTKTDGSDCVLVCYPAATGALLIPEGITKISAVAFRADGYNIGNENITSVSFPSTLAEIGTNGGIGAFYQCRFLTSVDMSAAEGLTEISHSAFAYCRSLASIQFPPKLATIGADAFWYCDGILDPTSDLLTSISLPAMLVSIGNRAFDGCKNLATIAIEAGTPPTLGEYALSRGTITLQHIYVPSASVEAYKTAEGWSAYAALIEAIAP
jgi:hypothetical protein